MLQKLTHWIALLEHFLKRAFNALSKWDFPWIFLRFNAIWYLIFPFYFFSFRSFLAFIIKLFKTILARSFFKGIWLTLDPLLFWIRPRWPMGSCLNISQIHLKSILGYYQAFCSTFRPLFCSYVFSTMQSITIKNTYVWRGICSDSERQGNKHDFNIWLIRF